MIFNVFRNGEVIEDYLKILLSNGKGSMLLILILLKSGWNGLMRILKSPLVTAEGILSRQYLFSLIKLSPTV